MCLVIKKGIFEPKKSKRGRICYKLIIRTNLIGDNSIGYTTPYQNKRLDEDIINGKTPLVANCRRYKWTSLVKIGCDTIFSDPDRIVEKGYIHAYTSIDAARLDWTYKLGAIIYRCVIPAGTEYFEGKKKDICARQIIFQKPVDLNKTNLWNPQNKE